MAYNGEDATPGAWRRVAQRETDALKSFNLDASRFKTIFGGQRKDTRVQLWVLPKDAPPPVPEAGAELPLAKTIKSGEFSAYDFAIEKNQTTVFTRLAEILREQQTVRAFLVVHLDQPMPPDEVSEDGQPPVIEPPAVEPSAGKEQTPIEEVEEIDLTKLVEKWRVEWAKTHKIGDDRLITLFTQGTDFKSNMLTIWIVPKGQPLPDPNEDDRELPEEETPATSNSSNVSPAVGKRP